MLTKNDLKLIESLITTNGNQLRNELKKDILTFKDEILKEITDLRVDVAILTGYRDMIEDHEIRIVKLERDP